VWPVAIAVSMIALAGVVVWRPFPVRRIAPLVLIILLAEAARFHARTDISDDPALFEVGKDFAAFSATRQTIDRVLVIPTPEVPFGRDSAITTLTGNRNVQGYHALHLYRYARLLREVGEFAIAVPDESGRLSGRGVYDGDMMTMKSLPLLNLLNVRHIVTLCARARPSAWQKRSAKPDTSASRNQPSACSTYTRIRMRCCPSTRFTKAFRSTATQPRFAFCEADRALRAPRAFLIDAHDHVIAISNAKNPLRLSTAPEGSRAIHRTGISAARVALRRPSCCARYRATGGLRR
jgi:hypothetical protein